jgi:hypothetical protein
MPSQRRIDTTVARRDRVGPSPRGHLARGVGRGGFESCHPAPAAPTQERTRRGLGGIPGAVRRSPRHHPRRCSRRSALPPAPVARIRSCCGRGGSAARCARMSPPAPTTHTVRSDRLLAELAVDARECGVPAPTLSDLHRWRRHGLLAHPLQLGPGGMGVSASTVRRTSRSAATSCGHGRSASGGGGTSASSPGCAGMTFRTPMSSMTSRASPRRRWPRSTTTSGDSRSCGTPPDSALMRHGCGTLGSRKGRMPYWIRERVQAGL